MAVEEEIRRLHETKGFGIFWPQQFAVLGDLDAILHALGELTRVKRLSVTAVVRCPDGHVVWEDELGRISKAARRCEECGQYADLDENWQLKFKITEDWKKALSKKKPWWRALLGSFHRRRHIHGPSSRTSTRSSPPLTGGQSVASPYRSTRS